MYLKKKLSSSHKEAKFKKMADELGIDFDKILECPMDIIDGIY